MVAAGQDKVAYKQNLLMNFIVAWFMMIVHFLGHFFFLDGLRVWSERVECPCPIKKEVVKDEDD